MSVDEDTRWLEWVTKQFETIAGEDKEIDLDEFKTALKVKEVRAVDVLRIFGSEQQQVVCRLLSCFFIFDAPNI